MYEINLTKNFERIFDTLQRRNMNITGIAKAMGYTTSAQLHSALKGESMLSTKAIISLIQNANVNPTYLFLGTGEMFLSETNEVDELRKKVQELTTNHNEALKAIMELNEIIKQLEKRNADLIDISAAAIQYFKANKELGLTGENAKNPLEESMEMLKRLSKKEGGSSVENSTTSTTKQKK